MPQKCSVPDCRGNYLKGPKVSVFSFPANEEHRLMWLSAIHRKDFIITRHSRVCELHFKDADIERSTSMYDEKNRKLVTAPLLKPRLAKGAVPSQFPDCPQYLSGTITASHKDPQKRRHRVENQYLENANTDSKDDELELKVNDIAFNAEWDLLKKESGEDGKPWEPSYHSVVCSQHFKAEDYKCCKMNRTRLKPGRIPSVIPKEPKKISKRLRKMSSKLDENQERGHSLTDTINIEQKASVKFEPVWLENSEESSTQEQTHEFDPLEDGSDHIRIKSECAESDRD